MVVALHSTFHDANTTSNSIVAIDRSTASTERKTTVEDTGAILTVWECDRVSLDSPVAFATASSTATKRSVAPGWNWSLNCASETDSGTSW